MLVISSFALYLLQLFTMSYYDSSVSLNLVNVLGSLDFLYLGFFSTLFFVKGGLHADEILPELL